MVLAKLKKKKKKKEQNIPHAFEPKLWKKSHRLNVLEYSSDIFHGAREVKKSRQIARRSKRREREGMKINLLRFYLPHHALKQRLLPMHARGYNTVHFSDM